MICGSYHHMSQDPTTLHSPEEREARHVDSSLVERRRLNVGDDEGPSVRAPERYIGNFGSGDRDLLDHPARWREDRDFASTVVGDVEVAGFVESHAVWTFPTGEEGK